MKTTQFLFICIHSLLLLAVSFDGQSQTTTICGGSVPDGWVTISVNGNCGANSTEISRTIQDVSGMSPGSTVTICGDPAPPAGWVTMSVNGNCGFDGSYISRTIKKVEGYTAESQMTICDSPAPAGWVTTSINGSCGFDGSYLSRTIKRISDLPSGTVFNDPVCGDLAPEGWITKSVNGNCGYNSAYIARTIKKIEGMAPGTEEEICGDLPPVGWITLTVNSNCGYNSSYLFRKIKKIDGLPSDTELDICGDLPPANWVTLSVSGNCGLNSAYIARKIKKVTCMPVGTFLTICGNDAIPNGWVIDSQNGNCGFNGTYSSRTIKKISGNPTQVSISGPQNTNICSGTSVSLSASNCSGGTIIWSTGAQGASINVAPTTTTDYSATCTQGECSSTSNTITITVSSPDVQVSPNASTCTGGSATLSASGCNGTYQWFNSSTSTSVLSNSSVYNTPPLNSNTTYYVNCMIGNCQSSRKSIFVTVSGSTSQPNSTGQTICAGTSTILTATDCSGTFKWYSSTTSSTVLASTANYTTPVLNSNTTYYVSCTVGSCESARTATLVTVTAAPGTPNSTGQTICSGKTVILTATGCSGSYKWFSSNTSTAILASTASYTTPVLNSTTTYYVSCTVSNCESTRKATLVTVNPTPGIPNSTPQTICSGKTATLTATGCSGTYKWYSSNTSTTILASTAGYTTPVLNNNTTYYVSCTVTNCESARKATLVTVNPTPVAPTASASGTAICNGQSVTLTATGCSGTVTWSNGASGSSISVGTTGTYAAKCTVNGCISVNSNVLTITSGNSGAPDNLTLSGTATAGVKAANKTITSTQVIPNGVNTTYNAGNNIILNPPFNATTGSIFKVEIKGCGS